jgi:membrane carboxypeptidase/penicillin-binding protein
VVDRHGQTIGQFFNERRRLTPLDGFRHVVDAFVAGEDSSSSSTRASTSRRSCARRG